MNEKRAWLEHPHFIKNLGENGGQVKKAGLSKLSMVRLMVDREKNSAKEKICWSGVRMLLFFIKYFSLYIANMTRELSKVNDGVNHRAFCELFHAIIYVLNTINLSLQVELSVDASKD